MFLINNQLWLSFYHKKVEFKNLFSCLGTTFTVPIEQEVTRIDKNGEKITKNISYKLKFNDSTRSMANSWSNFVDNLSEGLHTIKCKYGHNDKKCETCGISYGVCNCLIHKL